MAAVIRATSAGAHSRGGRAKLKVSTTAPRNPSTAQSTTVHRLAVVTMPIRHATIAIPQRTKGQARRSIRPETARSTKDAGSWPRLSAVSEPATRSARPASVRYPGRKALLQKYIRRELQRARTKSPCLNSNSKGPALGRAFAIFLLSSTASSLARDVPAHALLRASSQPSAGLPHHRSW